MSNSETGSPNEPFWLDDWYVDPPSGRISRAGAEVRLEPKVMSMLVLLAQRPGEVVSRETLEEKVWPGLVISYEALATTVFSLRKALGDDSRSPRYVETIPKKGFRIIAPVKSANQLAANVGPAADNPDIGKTRRAPVARSAAILVTLLAVIGYLLSGPGVSTKTVHVAGEPGEAVATLVVLPFVNSDRDPAQQYFSNGITDDLINDLSRYQRLRVVARRSSYHYGQRQVDIKTIAQELGVDYVLDGDIRRQGDRIRINVQLIDASRGINLWGQRFDQETRDLFRVQDDIRKNILSALSITLTREERDRGRQGYTQDFAAYDLFLQGQAKLVTRASSVDNDDARLLMEKAIQRDPNFARAHAALGLIYADAYRFNWSEDPGGTRSKAVKLVKRALELDNQSAVSYWIMGYIELFLSRDHAKAIEMAERSLELSPRNPDAITVLAVTHAFGDDPRRAKLLMQELMKTNRHYSSLVPGVLGLANLRLGNYSEALSAYEESYLINPSRIQTNLFMAVVLYRMGAVKDAEFQVAQLYSMHPKFDPRAWAARQPIKDKQFIDRIVEDFNQAGKNIINFKA